MGPKEGDEATKRCQPTAAEWHFHGQVRGLTVLVVGRPEEAFAPDPRLAAEYSISTDPRHLDIDTVHRFLTERAYWSQGVPRDVVERAIRGSLIFGVYRGNPGENLVGFARVVTDRATFAWLCDVFVLPAHRGKGLSRWLMQRVMAHPDLQDLRSFVLATRDAHGLYARFGFSVLENPANWMAIRRRPASYGS